MRVLLVSALLAILVAPSVAHAGRRPWIFAEDTATVPDGDVEIESWVGFIDRGDETPGEWHWWIGPYWSPIEQLEFAALTAMRQPYEGPSEKSFELWIEQLSLRWRVIERSFGALFLKVEGRIAFAGNTPFQVQPSIAWAKHVGRFGFAASFGYAAGFEGGGDNVRYDWLVYRAAVSFDIIRGEVTSPFQLGLELYSQEELTGKNDLTSDKRSSTLLGPTLAFAKGRLWLTVGTLAGLGSAGPTIVVRGIIGLSL
jgi:hypothetical protein